MKQRKRMTAWLLVATLLASMLTMGAVSAQEASSTIPEIVASEFSNPSAEYRAGFRYELPGGEVDQAQVKEEVKAAADAGFAVLEITASKVNDYTAYGLDSDAWRQTLKTIYSTCNELGIQADIHLSFNNGANLYVPGLAVTDDGVTKELVEASADIAGGTDLSEGQAVPVYGEAGMQDNVSRRLVTLLAAKVTQRKDQLQAEPDVTGFGPIMPATTNVAYLDESAVLDVTSSVNYDSETNQAVLNQNLTIGADGEDWVLIAFYEQGKAATSNVGSQPARKMDYFSQAGTEAFTEFYNHDVFDEELRAMMRKNGGDLFSDSYGADSNWTNDFLDIFQEYKGYDLTKYLPVLFSDSFEMEQGGVKIRNDHKDVLTDLYCKYHLDGLTEWANSLGLKYRDQVAYSASVDMMEAAMHVDVPETESLYFRDEIDNYVAMSAPANLTRKNMVSTEVGALSGFAPNSKGGYSQTWEDMLIQINRSLAGGVNQMLLHTYPYKSGTAFSWPGYTAFGISFSENWGTRLPSWQDAKDIADYTARAQYLMRQGVSQRDVVFYKHHYDWVRTDSAKGDSFVDIYTLTRDGYTYDFMNPSMMETENAYAKDGVIDPDGGAYKAFVIDSEQYPLKEYWARPAADMMPVAAAQKIQQYAQAGVPIVVVGEVPSRAEGFAESDDEVVRIFAEMEAAEQITHVSSESEFSAALRTLGIRPNADNNTPCGVTSYLRTADGISYYCLYNQGTFAFSNGDCYNEYEGEEICDQIISLKGEGRPCLMNLWTGEIIPIAEYTQADGYVNVPVRLAINEATVIALEQEAGSSLHAVKADGEVLYGSEGNLMLKAEEAGDYHVKLSDGSEKTIAIDQVANPVSLANWTLIVESWTPENEFGTTGDKGAATEKTVLPAVQLNELKPWSEIPEIGDHVSGIGTYTTTFTVNGPADGAVLSLGKVFDTVSVKVNGTEVSGINQSSKLIDLGSLVREGENTLEIQCVSTLRNALRTLDASYARTTVQEYGLMGPVTVSPYVMKEVTEAVVSQPDDSSSESADPTESESDSSTDSSAQQPNTGVQDSMVICIAGLMLLSGLGVIWMRKKAK